MRILLGKTRQHLSPRTSTIYGSTSGGSGAPPATLWSCAMRTTAARGRAVPCRSQGKLARFVAAFVELGGGLS